MRDGSESSASARAPAGAVRPLGCGADKHTATESLQTATKVPGVVERTARVMTSEADGANDVLPLVWSGGRASRGACNAADRVSATAVQKAGLIGQKVRCVVPGGEDGEQASLDGSGLTVCASSSVRCRVGSCV